MENLVPLHHFLGVSVAHRAGGLFLSQQQYMVDILARAGMSDCKPCTTLHLPTLMPKFPVMVPQCLMASTISCSCWCSALPDFHQTQYCLCCLAGVSSYAQSV